MNRTLGVIAVIASVIIALPCMAGSPAQAADCQAHQSVSKTIHWSGNCTVSTSSNSTSDLTTAVQLLLALSSFYSGHIDGVYGSQTAKAVRAFQKQNFPNDSSQWDGIVGPKTWGKLASMPHYDYSDNGFYYYYYNEVVMFRLDVSGSGKGNWATLSSQCILPHIWVAMNSVRHC